VADPYPLVTAWGTSHVALSSSISESGLVIFTGGAVNNEQLISSDNLAYDVNIKRKLENGRTKTIAPATNLKRTLQLWFTRQLI
jgi:hypothetical protein